MALSQQAIESMLQAMDIIATKQVKNVSYDQTAVCTIVDRSNASKQSYYTVTDGSARFKAYVLSAQEADEYDVDDQVYVKIPNGDYSKKKYIEGYYIAEDKEIPATYTSPMDTFLDITTLTTEGSQSSINEGLIANESAEMAIWSWRAGENDSADDLQINGIYDTLGLQADFRCLLNSYDMRSGSYGLRLDLYIRLTATSEKHITKSVYLDSSEMFGNPFAFLIPATQAKTFDISSLGIVDGMTLWFYQDNNFVYYNGSKEENVNSFGIPNIFISNVHLAFGSEMAEITDNTVKLYTTDTLNFRQLDPSDVNNTKTLGFLWYNKSDEGKYIGFSDGLVDFTYPENSDKKLVNHYDELVYRRVSATDQRLVAQMGKDVPKDENGLKVSADLEEGKEILKKIHLLIQKDLVNTAEALMQRVSKLSVGTESALDYLKTKIEQVKKDEKFLNNSDDSLIKTLVTTITQNLAQGAKIQKYQQDGTMPEEAIELTHEDTYKTISRLLDNITALFYSIIQDEDGNKHREFFLNELGLSIKEKFQGFQNIYDLYREKFDRIFNSLENYRKQADALLSRAEENSTNYNIDTEIEVYNKKDLSVFDNRYCIYWYRYNKGHIDPDGLMEANWERLIPGESYKDSSYSLNKMSPNLGLPSDYTEEVPATFVAKPRAGEGLLNIYLSPNVEEEKFKVVVYYNHERFDSNELVFTNTDPVVDPTTIDINDAISIKHGLYSSDTYQTLYSSTNSLINYKDVSLPRELFVEYDGLLGGNENLVGAQIFWYVPRHSTMLTVDLNKLKNLGFSTDYHRTGRVKINTSIRKGPGEEYGEVDTREANSLIDSIYDKQNGWYSLKSSCGIGATGRWVKVDDIELIENDEIFMDGYACFYKTIANDEDLKFYYKIKDYYVATAQQNIIFCIIKKDDYVFEDSVSFVFGTQGTSGTDYTLLITPSGDNIAVLNDTPLEVSIKAYNYDNEEIEIHPGKVQLEDGSLYGLSAEWRGPTKYTLALEEANDNIINSGQFILNKIEADDFQRYGIAKVNVNLFDSAYGGVKELSTLYPVPWSAGDYYIEGANSIIYETTGNNPTYYKDPYRIFRKDKNEEILNVSWGIKYYILDEKNVIEFTNASDVEESLRERVNFYLACAPKLNEQNKLVPCNFYVGEQDGSPLDVYPVVYCFEKLEDGKIGSLLWAQPILISQNRYASSVLNHWDGKFKIDEKNGTILSTMVGAGYKNEDNTFSGVLMGDVEINEEQTNTKTLGLYGYNHGAQSFGLSIDGTAFFGKSGRGRILIDGNNSTIQSQSYKTTDTGMLIDLDDGYIDMLGVSKDESGNYIAGAKKSHVRLDVEKPYFLVDDEDGNRLINIGSPLGFDSSKINEGYYLKSSDFSDADASGLLFDLNKGLIKSYGFTLDARGEGDNKLLIDSTAQTHPLTIGAASPNFKVAWDGTLEATGAIIFGNITAKDGNIGGWEIGENTISSNGLTLTSSDAGGSISGSGSNGSWSIKADGMASFSNVTITGGSLNINNLFKVNSDGAMTATSGTIGGWTINTDSLTHIINFNGTNYKTYLGQPAKFHEKERIVFKAGANFMVDVYGTLYANSAEISGKLTAGKDSKIGNWTISSDWLSYQPNKNSSKSFVIQPDWIGWMGTSGLAHFWFSDTDSYIKIYGANVELGPFRFINSPGATSAVYLIEDSNLRGASKTVTIGNTSLTFKNGLLVETV